MSRVIREIYYKAGIVGILDRLLHGEVQVVQPGEGRHFGYDESGVVMVVECDEPGCSMWVSLKVIPAKGWWHGHGQDFCPQHNGSDAQRKFADEAQATCPYCGAKFYPETANHRYCEPAHRVSAFKRKKKGLPERLPPPWPRWPSPGSGA